MNNDYLQHYGVKGQRWGVRRNRDASGGGRPQGPQPVKKKISADDIRNTKKSVDATADAVGKAKQLNEATVKKNNKAAVKRANEQIERDLAKLSDKELQQVVNRLNMEQRYSTVMSQQYASQGKTKTEKMMENSGKFIDGASTALMIGSSILSIALAVNELKG